MTGPGVVDGVSGNGDTAYIAYRQLVLCQTGVIVSHRDLAAVEVGRVAIGHRNIRVDLLGHGIDRIFREGDIAESSDNRRGVAAVHLIGDSELSEFGIPDGKSAIPKADLKFGQAGKTAEIRSGKGFFSTAIPWPGKNYGSGD